MPSQAYLDNVTYKPFLKPILSKYLALSPLCSNPRGEIINPIGKYERCLLK
jgi:hypothetical protein